MATGKKRVGRPRKALRDIQRDHYTGRDGRLHFQWCAFREHAMRRNVTAAKAESGATKEMARKFDLTTKQVRNIVARGDALRNDLYAKGLATGKKLNAQTMAFRQMHDTIERAVSVMRKPYYQGLLEQCAIDPRTKLPKALGELSRDTSPESLQRLAGMLARAFLDAHEYANREAPAYSEQKRKRN